MLTSICTSISCAYDSVLQCFYSLNCSFLFILVKMRLPFVLPTLALWFLVGSLMVSHLTQLFPSAGPCHVGGWELGLKPWCLILVFLQLLASYIWGLRKESFCGDSFCPVQWNCWEKQVGVCRCTVISIPNGPFELAVTEAAWGLARYAAISQVCETELLHEFDHKYKFF